MINLIPKEEKKKMTRVFYYKLALLTFFTLDFCVLVITVCAIPSYLFSFVQDKGANAKLEAQKNQPLPLFNQEALKVVEGINSKLQLVEKAEKSKFVVSEKVVNAILRRKRADIKLTQIFYQDDPALGRKISITGTATSRETLLLFRQALEDDPLFKNVDLPISNFVKGTNIEFSLKLMPV